eukprot:CAMPEP_0198267788 /NCGR_PEP_ID=MMETSP1447-20131203/34495_1 /TAXON_ID=420782 /ORGANISM="Chaetoceros dichaeta, Strain CCMP1751" /LENGTH=363 /DNA_ID=CAMNT_0043958531 /DNA_START=79 /DNA_END=1170 /DNA_ORIENTATION=-
MSLDDTNVRPSIDQLLKKSRSMVEINTFQSIRQINGYDDMNCNNADDDNLFFYNESSVEIQPLPDLDDNVEGRSSSSMTDDCADESTGIESNSKSVRRCQSQSVLVSSFPTCDHPTENYKSSDRDSKLGMDDEVDDDNFFFFEIENEVPSEDHPYDNTSSSPPKIMSNGPFRASRSASHLSEDIVSSSDNHCINRCPSPSQNSSSLRRCQSQSILKSSSSYNNYSCNNLHESASKIKPSTSFSTLEIREYPITLGDNPGGLHGPPIILGWEHNKRQTQVIPLEDYEEERPQRRSRKEMYMADNTRRWRLHRERGLSIKEIDKATKEAKSVRRQRKKSIQSQYGYLSNLKKKVGNIFGSVIGVR